MFTVYLLQTKQTNTQTNMKFSGSLMESTVVGKHVFAIWGGGVTNISGLFVNKNGYDIAIGRYFRAGA